jgi:ribonuclease-3
MNISPHSPEFLLELPHRNPKNKYLQLETVEDILSKFDINDKPNNLELYQRAFIHESYLFKEELKSNAVDLSDYTKEQIAEYEQCIPMRTDCYERLECLGDKVLGLTCIDYLYHRYPKQDPGFMTKTLIELVKKSNLAKLSGYLKWGQHLMLSRTYESHRYTDVSYLEDIFEAFLGALFLDFGGFKGNGIQVVQKFVVGVMEYYINLSAIIFREDNYKDLLLQYYHKTFDGHHPRYTVLSTKDKYGKRMYTVGVLSIDEEILVTSSDQKKIKAEQKASKLALEYFNQPTYDSDEEGDRCYTELVF